MLTALSAKIIGVALTVLVAGGVSYVTFEGLISSQVNSSSSSPGDVSDPAINYGE